MVDLPSQPLLPADAKCLLGGGLFNPPAPISSQDSPRLLHQQLFHMHCRVLDHEHIPPPGHLYVCLEHGAVAERQQPAEAIPPLGFLG